MNKKRLLIIIGIVVAVVVLVIIFDMVLANHQPAITSLVVEPEKVIPGGSCQIVCNATDRDGDELLYGWSASGGEISGEGATVTWKAPRNAGSYNVTVIVTDGRGSVVTDYVTISVRTNKLPTITSLEADADWTHPSDSLNVTCTASDLDGDELSYEWSTTGGSISGTDFIVNWTAPQEVDVYYITVVVSDDYGGSDTRTLPISVVTGQPPTIEDLVITAEHCYLRTNTSPYKVGLGKEYNIQCIVADVGIELSYSWSCTDGDISDVSEDGSMIAWVAPNKSGRVTITVIVSDIADNKAVKNLLLEVASCTTCTFPGCTG